MEALIFAFIAVRISFRPGEPVIPETPTFQPLDLQSLRYVYEAKERSAHRSGDRNDSHLAQALS
jgi:hypothetical protein